MKKIIILLLLSLQVFAAVATITAIKGKATIQRDGSEIVAVLGSTLEQKDDILTQDNTKLQLIFEDETIISIGKNSHFSINEYLFEDNQAPIAKFGMIRGAMRTITGKIGDVAPERFSVATKTATIGIRGTNFSVLVGEDGSYQAYCTFGAISIDIQGETFVVHQGSYVSVSNEGKVEVKEFSAASLKEMKTQNFSFDKKKPTDSTPPSPEVVAEALESTGNSEQINVTVSETSSITITEVTEVSTDGAQTTIVENGLGETTADLTTLIAGYGMNNASYTGTYTLSTGYYGDFVDGNPAHLAIDFGADTVSLTLNHGLATAKYIWDQSPAISGTSIRADFYDTGGVATGDRSMQGNFQGATGNQVTGSYEATLEDILLKGTYDVTSSQVLE